MEKSGRAARSNAAKIPVKSLRQTLVWPFILSGSNQEKSWYNKLLEKFEATGWRKVEDPLDLIPADEISGPYEEAVYFHDFVRSGLYQRSEQGRMWVLQRFGTSTFEACIDSEWRQFRLECVAMHIYAAGTAVLTLDLAYAGEPLTLAQTQNIIDALRRAYPPFWDAPGKPGYSPSAVRIGKTFCALGPLRNRAAATKALRRKVDLSEPLFSWWQHLIAPLPVAGTPSAQPDKPHFRQVFDERIPLITTVSLSREDGSTADLERVSNGDWFRLAAADPSGNDPFPYNPDFLDTQRGVLFYDRHAPHPDASRTGATRFMFAGYHFAAVGAGWFFDTVITSHMRRHYRQMMHICLLEFAVLLRLSDQLSRAARMHEECGQDQVFRGAVIDIEREFLDFTHTYRFTGVSNQLQAREMFDRMRASMGLEALYADIKSELESAAQLALSLDQRDAAKAAAEAANNTEALTGVATVVAVVGLTVGAGGMNILIGPSIAEWANSLGWLRTGGLAFDLAQFGAILTVTAGVAQMMMPAGSLRAVRRAIPVLIIAGVLGLCLGLYASVEQPSEASGKAGLTKPENPTE